MHRAVHHPPLRLPHLELLVDVMRGAVSAHGPRLGVHLAKSPPDVDAVHRMGFAGTQHSHLGSFTAVPRRKQRVSVE